MLGASHQSIGTLLVPLIQGDGTGRDQSGSHDRVPQLLPGGWSHAAAPGGHRQCEEHHQHDAWPGQLKVLPHAIRFDGEEAWTAWNIHCQMNVALCILVQMGGTRNRTWAPSRALPASEVTGSVLPTTPNYDHAVRTTQFQPRQFVSRGDRQLQPGAMGLAYAAVGLWEWRTFGSESMTSRRTFTVIWLITCGLFSDPQSGAGGAVQQIGGGSMAVALPAGATTPPETIFAVPGLERKMPTNDWWSSLAWMPYSERQYPHPLAVCAAASGLRVYYPGNRITPIIPTLRSFAREQCGRMWRTMSACTSEPCAFRTESP